MKSVVKQRLVGTLVLIALGVVFWPIIFVTPAVVDPIQLEPMPTRPVFDRTPIAAPTSPRAEIEASMVAPEVDAEAQEAADRATAVAVEAEDQSSDQEVGTAKDPDSAIVAAAASLPSTRETDPAAPRNTAPAPPERDENGFALSWVLQVATVSSEQRAQRLVAELQAKGYEAFSRRFQRDGEDLWRVQVGPKLEKAKFDPIKAVIDPAFQVKSRVIRYVQ